MRSSLRGRAAEARQHPTERPIDHGRRLVEAQRQDGAGGVRTDARKPLEVFAASWNAAPMPLNEHLSERTQRESSLWQTKGRNERAKLFHARARKRPRCRIASIHRREDRINVHGACLPQENLREKDLVGRRAPAE